MSELFGPVQDLLNRVRARWRRLVLLESVARAALACAGVIATALVLTHWTSRSPVALAVIGAAALVGSVSAIGWGIWPAKRAPGDRALARFIEEHDPSLDERLVSAVDVH